MMCQTCKIAYTDWRAGLGLPKGLHHQQQNRPRPVAVQTSNRMEAPQRANPLTSSIKGYSRVATGLMTRAMDMSGSRMWLFPTGIGARTATAIGLTRIGVGPGSPMKTSAGQLTAMVGGHGEQIVDGSGFRVANGHQPGSLGDKATITWAGPHYPRKWRITHRSVSKAGLITTMILVRRRMFMSAAPGRLCRQKH